jgi:hypothetical protein
LARYLGEAENIVPFLALPWLPIALGIEDARMARMARHREQTLSFVEKSFANDYLEYGHLLGKGVMRGPEAHLLKHE